MTEIKNIKQHVLSIVNNDAYVVFRIFFGLIMAFSIVRMQYKGWIESFYTNHDFYFKYQYFEWVAVPPLNVIYGVFVLLFISSICIALGLLYRVNTIIFFVTFTYTELWDKTYYLNHHYFIFCIAFLLLFIPLNDKVSIDRYLHISTSRMRKWHLYTLQFQIGLVYFFAGIAKLKYSWLIEAMPMKIWLASKTSMPIIGDLFTLTATPYVFSWIGMLFDLTVPFFLLSKKTRAYAYVVVLGFHLTTYLLFNIGLFPFIMSGMVIVFFNIQLFKSIKKTESTTTNIPLWTTTIVVLFVISQTFIPLRHYFIKGDMLWTEQGYRFAWHVMLKEKNGHVTFRVENKDTGRETTIITSDYLCSAQEHQMSFQPDMIVEFARFIKTKYPNQDVSVYADTYVSLNGKRGRPILDRNKDLLLNHRLEEIIIP